MSPNVGTAEIAAMKVHAIASYASTRRRYLKKASDQAGLLSPGTR